MFPQVLATVGGSGTRLYPLTLDQPKPLVELCDTAIIANLFRVLASQGCRRFILGSKGANNTLNLSNYFKAGEGFFKRLGITDHQDFSYQPLYDDQGSADSLRYCMNYFDINDDLLVVSGDNLIDIDLKSFVEFHKKHKPMLTVALKEIGPAEDISQYGVARLDDDMRIEGFVEKPKSGSEPSRMINTAFYLFSSRIREVLAQMGDKARDIGGDLIPYLTGERLPRLRLPHHRLLDRHWHPGAAAPGGHGLPLRRRPALRPQIPLQAQSVDSSQHPGQDTAPARLRQH